MGRGKSLNHKKKSHPGDFPKGSERQKSKHNSHEKEYLVTDEAFKNRVRDE
ncbi:hypothetical protein LGQ02_11660 [Bacillus shivajii]|uniref:hypothetical protein n=1 Tax=Bacillus shivajii TaxID=1983719 RepID=UPI001CF9A5FC|nr:hypothetical protein [Bacillus shivajii]UCZ51528.1 hypothetical protein LGQ02_11660 [Bacillus shivajii]